MQTALHTYNNTNNDTIRGIITKPEWEVSAWLLCLSWFERNATTEKKFKKLADTVAEKTIATFRFDFSGCGLSDGDFSAMNIQSQWEELLWAIETFKREIWDHKIHIVAHSLGACVLAEQMNNLDIDKIILLAPALNQRDLLRYRFTQQSVWKNNPLQEVRRDNYKEFFDEEAFLIDCARTDKNTKTSYANPAHYLYAKDKDYSDSFSNKEVLHIHGDRDYTVPIDSIQTTFPHKIIVEGGNHDIEKPQDISQRLDQIITFLLKDNL